MKETVDKELDRLVAEGTLEPVQFSDWASPIVPMLKADKSSVRICEDFKQTINPVSKLDRYPIPKIEDLFASLAGGQSFTKIDLSQAYQQLLLDDESKQYVVINTHRGLFRYTRLPFGVSSAPGIVSGSWRAYSKESPALSYISTTYLSLVLQQLSIWRRSVGECWIKSKAVEVQVHGFVG